MQNKFVGMIVPDISNTFFSSLAYSAQDYLQKQGYNLLICSSTNQVDTEKTHFANLTELGVAGILCISGLSSIPNNLLNENIPLVFLDRRPANAEKVFWVANDDVEATRLATQFLIDKGCKNILMILGYIAGQYESLQEQGYIKALESNNIAVNESYILKRPGKQSSHIEAEKMVNNFLRRELPVDGIIASSDRSAFGALKAFRSVGLYVPEDVKMISFDDTLYAELATPALTSLNRQPKQLAQTACDLLIQQINGKPSEKIIHYVPVTLEKRDSTR
ncbi:MAG: substrate-binding domain-containing protein [Selenomonadaceae bacterium]|nr:substrate-binding domain-containing protein [Selenomonadaceae bacterium]